MWQNVSIHLLRNANSVGLLLSTSEECGICWVEFGSFGQKSGRILQNVIATRKKPEAEKLHIWVINWLLQVCWVYNTYYVSFEERIPKRGAPRNTIGYYQWVALVLCVMVRKHFSPHVAAIVFVHTNELSKQFCLQPGVIFVDWEWQISVLIGFHLTNLFVVLISWHLTFACYR